MTDKDEILLTTEEIKEIEEYARQNPHLKDPNVINIFGPGHKTIWKISPKHELIIIKGNEHTGFEHIHRRHEFWSEAPNWIDIVDKSGQKRKKLQDQSKFRTDSIPFWDYANIADSVYSPDNLDTQNNRRPDNFDLFVGLHKHKDGSTSKYRLFTYKDTKIVHTLHPQSTKNNRKRIKKFDFARGAVSVSEHIQESIIETIVPYYNHEGKTKYSIMSRKFLATNTEECLILIHNDKEEPDRFVRLGQRPFESFDSAPFEQMRWQHSDLSGFEQHIRHIDETLKKE